MGLGDLHVGAVAGAALDEATRLRLERGFRTDLSAIRIHADGTADRLARALRTDAFAAGAHLFFRAGAYRPRTDNGLRLLAHEVAHAVQQQTAAVGPGAEAEAEAAAVSILAGEPVRLAVRPGALRDEPARAIQRHESFEHRSLGDVPTEDIHTLALRTDQAKIEEIIERETSLMWKWHQNPEKVTATDVAAICPWVRTVTLPSTGLLVTYGELNALPDYIASAQAIDTCPRPVLLALLQSIRQETFVQLNALRKRVKKDRFQDAPFGPDDWQIGLLNKVFNTWALDDTTRDLGTNGIDHYSGLLARNACHFAPYTWYRWQAAYLIAADLAKKAHAARESAGGPLTVQAWTYHGYADHFLQDSFAAGHLINKTLVMQWFVKWADESYLPVEDWALIKDMTTTLQPGLGSARLYGAAYPGPGTDPQTVEEQATYDLRLALSGVTAYQDPDGAVEDQKTAYQHYLTFLSSVVTQAASNALHDAFNERSLWVASEAHPTPYRVFGDDTLFTGADGSDGARITSEAAQRSQQSIHELLTSGETEITAAEIRRHFPTRAGDAAASVDSLETWAFGQERWAIDNVFSTAGFGAKRVATQLFPRLLNFSKDQEFANTWCANLSNSGFNFADVVMAGDRLFASTNGQGYELRPRNGEVIHQWTIRSNTVAGTPIEMHLATDGSKLYAGHLGYVDAFNLDTQARVWSAPMTGLSSWPVHVCSPAIPDSDSG
jgi:hypothetical protein